VKRLVLPVVVAASLLLLAPAPAPALPAGTRVQRYEAGLNFPVDMAWVKGTRKLFFTQKGGKIRVMKGRRLLSRACRDLDVDASGERGLLGLALHPRFKKNHFLYAFYVNRSPLESRVTRFRVRDNRCRRPRHIVDNIPVSGSYHLGGQLEFVGGKLFVSVGDAHNAANAQNKRNRLGKILRLFPNGSIPRGNPFNRPGDRNPVWSYGHRNGFGLTRKPGTTKLFESENGPQCDDELNRIRKGRNYGWGPGYSCGSAGVGARPKRPLKRWASPIAVTDPWWYRGRMRRLNGDIYVGGYNSGGLHRLVVNRKGTRVRQDRVIYDADSIVDVTKGPRGWLYFSTPSAIFRIVRR
jgi:aldose sugar dehydrogenase